jgi:hypothetical protein
MLTTTGKISYTKYDIILLQYLLKPIDLRSFIFFYIFKISNIYIMSLHSIETLFTASIIVDTIMGYLLLFNKNGEKSVRQWYKELTIGAYVMDIASIIIGTYLATLLSTNFYMQLFYVVIIGLIHDISFFTFLINVNTKNSKVLEILKNYGNENGKIILVIDALMLISTLLVSNYLLNNFLNANIIFLGVLSSYIGLLMIYSF